MESYCFPRKELSMPVHLCLSSLVAVLAVAAHAEVPKKAVRTVKVTNPATVARTQETVEVPWTAGPAVVQDAVSGEKLVTQLLDGDGDGKTEILLFQADFKARATRTFKVRPATEAEAAVKAPIRAYGRFVPERMDDYAWENDRMAFRVYGPTLEQPAPKGEGLVSSSVDVWCKRTRELVLDRWYKSGAYHQDHGEGCDFYKCGTGRGCGGVGVWNGGKLFPSKNWRTRKTLAVGPIRTVVELTYEPWEAGGVKVQEKRRISLDAGSNLNRFESVFTVEGAPSVRMAVGLDVSKEHKHDGVLSGGAADGWITNWEPEFPPNGQLGTAILLPGHAAVEKAEAQGHVFLIATATSGKPFVWHAGAGWNKSGDFADGAAWKAYVAQRVKALAAPLQVALGKP